LNSLLNHSYIVSAIWLNRKQVFRIVIEKEGLRVTIQTLAIFMQKRRHCERSEAIQFKNQLNRHWIAALRSQ
jgi:hypothetical protein